MRWLKIQISIQRASNAVINVQLAMDWLVKSGIQDEDGGFYGWYNAEKCEYSFLYPEITGYAIQLLCKMHLQDASKYLVEAVSAADWLLSIQGSDGSFFCKRFGKSATTGQDNTFYTFDAGIISSALFKLYKLTSKEEYISAALKTMNLVLTLQNSDGSFNAARTPDGTVLNNAHWSQTSSCHHLKLLLPLLQTYTLTLDNKFLKASKKLLHWGLNLQLPTGRFLDFNGSKTTYTHAHCYATEGLLGASECFDFRTNAIIKQKIGKSLDWLLNIQNSDGSVYNWNDNRPDKIKVSESLAQALRLYLLTNNRNIKAKHFDAGMSFLKQTQLIEGNRRVYGGIIYGRQRGKKLSDVSTCATIFALDTALLNEQGQTCSLIEQII